jgi:hypothetical protein
VPAAFSNGNGSFDVRYYPSDEAGRRFASWASVPGAQIVTGDFDADGRTDLALTGAPGWTSVPVAFSNGNGSFRVTNAASPNFASWASVPGVTVTSGDFDHDGRTDLALVPGPNNGWTTFPVALSNGDGTFTVTNAPASGLASWAQVPGVRVVTGDFNNDGRADLALVTGPSTGWYTLPVAFSNGDGTFAVTNAPSAVGSWAQVPGATVVSGDFDANGRTDIVLTGAAGWTTVPMASSNGDGTFVATNEAAADFAKWAAQPAGAVIEPGTWYGHPYGLLVSEKMVTVNWFDRSDNERGFQVENGTSTASGRWCTGSGPATCWAAGWAARITPGWIPAPA